MSPQNQKQPCVSKEIIESYIRLGKAHGKLGIGKIVGLRLRSKLDRLLASK